MESKSEITIFSLKTMVKTGIEFFLKISQIGNSFSDPLTYFIKGKIFAQNYKFITFSPCM